MQQLDYHGEHLFTNDINLAKRYTSKIDAVKERSDYAITEGTTVEEHQQ